MPGDVFVHPYEFAHLTVTLLWMSHPWGEFALFKWLCVVSSYSPSPRMLELPWCELRVSQVLPVGTLGPTCLEMAAGCRPMSLSWSWVPCNTIFLASGAQLSPTRLRKGFSSRYLLDP